MSRDRAQARHAGPGGRRWGPADLRRSRTRLGILLLAVLAACGCAKRGPPGGGPPDIEPPRVIASFPDSGAAGVAVDARFSVTFSEGMEPRTSGEAVGLAPYVPVRKRVWHGRTLTVELAESLRVDHVYTLFVAGGARDRHGNPMGVGHAVVFSTGDSFPPGRIEGSLEARGFTGPGTYLWSYPDSIAGPDSTGHDFTALGQSDANDHFRIDGLPVPGSYRLWAFADLNHNRSFEPSSDILARIDTTLVLTSERPVASDLAVRVVNPRAPGRVRGAVIDSLVDSLGVLRVIAQSEQDSTRRAATDVGPKGVFDLQLDPGPWVLRAIRDLDRSRTWQPDQERASAPFRLVLAPAADTVDVRLILRREIQGAEDR